jgi:acetyl esterase/lipase
VDLFDEKSPSLTANQPFDLIPAHLTRYVAGLYADPSSFPLPVPEIGGSEPEPVSLPVSVSATDQPLHDLPPLLVEIGDCEILRDQIVLFVEKVKAAGGDVTMNLYAEMVHDFQMLSLSGMEACKLSFANMKVFVDKLSFCNNDEESSLNDIVLAEADIDENGNEKATDKL